MTEFSPMLAIASTGASGRHPVTIETLVGTHVFDLKVDGIRCIALRPDRDSAIRLINRNGVDITYRYPEIVEALANSAPFLYLDGEIVAEDGKFETALMRDKQENARSIRRLVNTHPCRLVLFDVPPVSPETRDMSWERRRQALGVWYGEDGANADKRISLTPYSYEPTFLDEVAKLGMEGVIAKRIGSRYQPGKRSADWIKFKLTHRISCLVRGYNPGTGSRAHFGALALVLYDSHGGFVDVGTVGSGFTTRQTHELKARLDAGEVLVVEIETLNVTSGGQLRFPVFKGVRTDVSPLDCTTDQLATLPRC